MNGKLLSIVITIITIMSLVTPLNSTSNSSEVVDFTGDTISSFKASINQHYVNNLENLANTLIRNADLVDNSSIRWKKILNAPNSDLISDQYYPGLYSGVAGIGFLFEKLYQYSQNQSYLEIAKKSANYVISQEKISNSAIYWSRSEFVLSSSYSSQKYGPTGISDFFLSMYNITNDQQYLNITEQALNGLINNNIEDDIPGKSWGYSYFGSIPVSGLTYGSTGIISSFLNIYDVTKNVTYFNEALHGLDWILHLSSTGNSSIGTYRSIIYSDSMEYPYNYTGYSSGVAGIGDLFLKFYSITNNNTYLEYAKQIGNWLLLNEHDGQWLYGGVDYLTDSYNEDGNYLGFATGSAGIGMFLLNLYSSTLDENYLTSIQRIHELFNQLVKIKENTNFYTVQTTGMFENITKTGINDGVAGIGLFLNKYYRTFKNDSDLQILQGLGNFLSSITTAKGMIPIKINASRTYYDSSLFEGLAGIGLYYLDTILTIADNVEKRNSILNTIIFLDSYHNEILDKFVSTIPIQNEQSGQNSQKSSTLPFNFDLIQIISFMVIFKIIRRKRLLIKYNYY